MTSAVYKLFAQAMRAKSQIVCTYNGHRREVCPIVLGHTGGEEKALTFQVGGTSSSSLPPGGEWRCLTLVNVRHAALHAGPWRAGDSHAMPQSCVEDVDIDVNPASPYRPKRRV